MMKVNVYRNLKRIPSVLSIRCAVSGLVLGHAKHCELIDAKFVVQPSGQLRTRKEQQKNVHAWVVGTLDSVTDYLPNKKRDLSPDVTNQDPDGLEFVRQLREGHKASSRRFFMTPTRMTPTSRSLLRKRFSQPNLCQSFKTGLCSPKIL